MTKRNQRQKRKIRVRKRIQGTKDTPRLSVFRSNRSIGAQLINDQKGETLIFVTNKHVDGKGEKRQKVAVAKAVGLLLAEKALLKKVKKVVFDKGSYAYHGRVKAVAEGAREGGLAF